MNKLLLLFIFVSISFAQIIGGGSGRINPGGTWKLFPPSAGCEGPFSIIEEYTGGTGGTGMDGVDDTLFQSFSHSSAFTLQGDSSDFYYNSGGDAGDSLVLWLMTDDAGEPGTVISGTRTAIIWSDLNNASAAYRWYEFPEQFEGSASTTYWISVSVNAAFNWAFPRNASGTYPNGNIMYVLNGGSRTEQSAWDMNFRLMGCE